MKPLPNECLFMIFNIIDNLFSCLLVNRQWCRIIIPMLWSRRTIPFNDIKFIRLFLLMLNEEEQALLIPFNISIPKYPKPLFEYTNYITSVNDSLDNGIDNWLQHESYVEGFNSIFIEKAVRCSLIAMFLRTGKNLKSLSFNGIICNKIIFEKLYKNTTIIQMNYCIKDDNKSEAMKILGKILYKNTTLTSLGLIGYNNKIGVKLIQELVEALCKSTTLTYLSLHNIKITLNGWNELAKGLCKNINLTSLKLDHYQTYNEGMKMLVYCNTTLKFLSIWNNFLGSLGVKMLAEALYKNTTLTSLSLRNNRLGHKGWKALAEILCNKNTLTSLSIQENRPGIQGGKALAEALSKNTTLASLNLQENRLGPEVGKALAEALIKNTTLTSLNLQDNRLGFEGMKALVEALSVNTTLTFLNIEDNNVDSDEMKTLAAILCKKFITNKFGHDLLKL